MDIRKSVMRSPPQPPSPEPGSAASASEPRPEGFSDFWQLLVSKEEVHSVKQEWRPIFGQEEPDLPHIKVEQEELSISQEGEQLQKQEEADIKFPITPIPVKSESDEEKPHSSQLHQSQTDQEKQVEPSDSISTKQMKTEPDGEDFGLSEPTSNLDQDGDLEPASDDFQQLLVSREVVHSVKQEWSPSLGQEDPELPHIKVEQEKLLISHKGEQLQKQEEADIKFPITPVPVKNETDKEKPHSSQLHQSQTEQDKQVEPSDSTSTEQMKTEPDGKDFGLSRPASTLDQDGDLDSTSDDFQQLLVSKEVVHSVKQEWSPSLSQEEPDLPHIKVEQEKLLISQEGEQLQKQEETDIRFPFPPVPVKSGSDEEKPHSSQLHQSQTEEDKQVEPSDSNSTQEMKTEPDGEDFGLKLKGTSVYVNERLTKKNANIASKARVLRKRKINSIDVDDQLQSFQQA
ncbi:uncharacterized protein LOC130130960 [Lampris incognitus]|uniref:uncharacterized protein LOC130130960 n=1 Tax=Lampris incognitus TaxID=2546036 RepID=UPI0024B4D651|nr:uncharacterized protein LOC130130960 [Lampris incognitus]